MHQVSAMLSHHSCCVRWRGFRVGEVLLCACCMAVRMLVYACVWQDHNLGVWSARGAIVQSHICPQLDGSLQCCEGTQHCVWCGMHRMWPVGTLCIKPHHLARSGMHGPVTKLDLFLHHGSCVRYVGQLHSGNVLHLLCPGSNEQQRCICCPALHGSAVNALLEPDSRHGSYSARLLNNETRGLRSRLSCAPMLGVCSALAGHVVGCVVVG